jgi:hypothetical protein
MLPIIAAIVAVLILFSLLVVAALAALMFFRWYSKTAESRLREIYWEFKPSDVPDNGRVHVIFHTYSGLLAWFTQTKHSVYLPTAQARGFLKCLRNYNFKWGLFSYGGLFVPFLTWGSYWSQSRAITRQEEHERV